MSDRYERDLIRVKIVRVLKSGLENDDSSDNLWANGDMCEEFFFSRYQHQNRDWNFGATLVSQVSDSLVRFRHDEYRVPYDCSIRGELGDVKRYSVHTHANMPSVGDIISVACSPKQIRNCKFYYVVAIRYRRVQNGRFLEFSWSIYYCRKASSFEPPPVAQPAVAQQQVVPRGVVFAGLPGNPFVIRTSVAQPDT